MPSYRLYNVSTSTWEILSNRKKVGFVRTCPKGYVARLGQHCETAATAKQAFAAVAVKALGFNSVAALMQHNATTRANNAAHREELRVMVTYAMEQNERGNLEPFLQLLARM